MGKRRALNRNTFNDIEQKRARGFILNKIFEVFVTERHILFLEDKFVRFGNHKRNFHDSKRPTAVVKKEITFARIVPGTSQKSKEKSSVFIPAGAVEGLKKDGWFLTRYLQKIHADEFLGENNSIKPGGKIPAQYYEEILEKMNLFIERQVR